MADLITFEDKVSVRDSGYPRKNSVISEDLNEIKTKYNALVEEFNNLEGSENIMNTDLTATADRIQDLDSNSMFFTNGKQFKWLNNVAPTIGEGSYDLEVYGTTSSDIIFRLKNGASAVKMKVLGDGSSEWLTGFHSFGDSINTGAKLQGVTNLGGVKAVRAYHYGSGGIAGEFVADGANAVGALFQAAGFGGSALKPVGYYALDFNGRILDATQSTTPVTPQSDLAGEAALVASIGVGQWYYLDSGAGGIGTVKVRLS